MQIASILSPERVIHRAQGGSKKRTLEHIASSICQNLPQLNISDVLDGLVAREKLGSTGLGNGIAIPHCRLQGCDKAYGALMSLERGIDFDAIDGASVDLLFVLLVPTEACDEHLQILATLARRFSNDKFCANLRNAGDAIALYHAAIEPD